MRKKKILDGRLSTKLKGKILETLNTGAQGMFRWVQMSLETLIYIKYKPDFEKALGRLPARLSDLYDVVHAQINQAESLGRDVATHTLKWLLCAQRLLSVGELLSLVGVQSTDESESDVESGDEQRSYSENIILRLCRNLVVMNSEQKVFRFAHQSVREHLSQRPEYTIDEQHKSAIKGCIDIYLDANKADSPCKDYADIYWPAQCKHAEGSNPTLIREKLSQFLFDGSQPSPIFFQWLADLQLKFTSEDDPIKINASLGLDPFDPFGYQLEFTLSTPETLLNVACAFGLSKLLDRRSFSDGKLNECRHLGDRRHSSRSLVEFAAWQGYHEVVQLLLENGAEVDLRGQYSLETALISASAQGHQDVVRLLLSHGANVNLQDHAHGNALRAAVAHNRREVVQILLDHGVDANSTGGPYGNVLQVACEEASPEITRLLVDNGADVNFSGGLSEHSLHVACHRESEEIVQLLIEMARMSTCKGIRVTRWKLHFVKALPRLFICSSTMVQIFRSQLTF